MSIAHVCIWLVSPVPRGGRTAQEMLALIITGDSLFTAVLSPTWYLSLLPCISFDGTCYTKPLEGCDAMQKFSLVRSMYPAEEGGVGGYAARK